MRLSFPDLTKQFGVAITGGIASGKSTVAGILRTEGHVVIDADQVSRLVVLPGTEGFREVVESFGEEILTASGEMNRAKMREIIFNDSAKRLKLEAIVHQRLQEVSEGLLEKEGIFTSPRPWFYEASLIFERGRAQDFLQVWVVYAARETQIERVMRRDAIDRGSAEKILEAQMSPDLKRAQADYVIESDCSLDELRARTLRAFDLQLGGLR